MSTDEKLDNLEAALYDMSEQVLKLNDTVSELNEVLARAVKVAVARG